MHLHFLKTVLYSSLFCGVCLIGHEALASTQISVEKAKEIALEHAKITDKNVFFAKSKLDTDKGITEYEIEFFHNENEYEIDIDATSGEVKSFTQETKTNTIPKDMDMSPYITDAQAKEIAIKHANITADQIQYSQVEFQVEAPQNEYDVDLYTDKSKYEYEINATTGNIIESKTKTR